MINLIPKEEKKKIIKNFYYRLVILFFSVVSAVIFVSLLAILPSYFLSSARSNIVNLKLEVQKSEPVPSPQEETLTVIKDLNTKLSLIEKNSNKQFLISQKVIDAILARKMSNIKITNISYQNDSSTGTKISIQGIAPSREVLLSFRLALEGDKLFKQVDLPISNFIKGSNIQFSLSLIPAS